MLLPYQPHSSRRYLGRALHTVPRWRCIPPVYATRESTVYVALDTVSKTQNLNTMNKKWVNMTPLM